MAARRKFLTAAVLKPWEHSELYKEFRSQGVGFRTGLILVFLGLAFSLTSIIQAACGHFPAVPVILPLRLENYFVWQALLIVPWIVLSWLLVSLLVKVLIGSIGYTAVSLRQVMVLLGLGFSSLLFLLWIPHLLTAVFYLLGMSQKEWVDLLSQPGWFQTLYLVLIALAILAGWLSVNLSLGRISKKKRLAGFLVANLGFLTWFLLLVVILR